ncbi:unnamed protein product, partial [Meganyctiphanes norvegica]
MFGEIYYPISALQTNVKGQPKMTIFVLLHTLLHLLVETQGLPNNILRNTIVPRRIENNHDSPTNSINRTTSPLDLVNSPHNSTLNFIQESLLRPPEHIQSLRNKTITTETVMNVKYVEPNLYLLRNKNHELNKNLGSEYHKQKHSSTEKLLSTDETHISELNNVTNTTFTDSNSDSSIPTSSTNVTVPEFNTISTLKVYNTTKSNVFRRSVIPEDKIPELGLTNNTKSLLTTESNNEGFKTSLSGTKPSNEMYSDMDIGPFHIPKNVLTSARHKYEEAISHNNETDDKHIINLSELSEDTTSSDTLPNIDSHFTTKLRITQNTSKTMMSHPSQPFSNINKGQEPSTESPQLYKPMKSGDTFEVTETGDFEGFSVTKTEEVEASKKNINNYNETVLHMVSNSSKSGNNQSREQAKNDYKITINSPSSNTDKENTSNFVPKQKIYDNGRKINMEKIRLIHKSEINNEQSVTDENTNKVLNLNPSTEGALLSSTLPDVFNEDLIPPLPHDWQENDEQQWKNMYWENSDSSEEYSRPKHKENKDNINLVPLTEDARLNGEENYEKYLDESQLTNSQGSKYKEDSEEPPYELESESDIFPFHIPKNVMTSVQEKIKKENSSSHLEISEGSKKQNDIVSKVNLHMMNNMASKVSNSSPQTVYDREPLLKSSNSNKKLYDFSENKFVDTEAVPEASVSDITNKNQHADIVQTEKADYHKRLGNINNKLTPWPVNGDHVDLVTVRSAWPSLWVGPKVNSTSEHVYSVYWSQRDMHGPTESLTMGIWITRGGSMFAVATLIITIVVQVVRGDPYVRSSVPPSDPNSRAHLSQRATITTNLATSLAAAHVLFILGIQAPPGSWTCGVVGLLLHFLHLVSCCWLLLLTAGLLGHLHRRPPIHTAIYCVLAWTASLAFVVVSYMVNPEGYETHHYCWMSVERGMLISFIVPVCTLIMINAVLCVAAQKALLDMRDGMKNEAMQRYQRSFRAAVCLLPLEGVSWFIGVVAIEDDQSYALDVMAAFVNAFLGWLVFYFYGSSLGCHGPCWLRQRFSRRPMEDLTLTLSPRYEGDHQ